MTDILQSRRSPRALCASLSLFTLLLFCSFASAQLPSARLTAIFPPGGKAGTTVDAAISGADLDGITELHFSNAGITAKLKDESDSITDRKVAISISQDVPPGIYEVRAVCRYGITNPRAFVVSDQPELLPPAKPNGPPALPIGSVFNARCQAAGVDQYTLDLKKDQRILIECQAGEIDSKLSPVLILNSPDGPDSREVARSRAGGFLDYTPTADGTYTLQVHDLLFKGGPEYFYRISAGTGPHLDAIFPPAGLPGSKAKYTLYGRNLPDGKPAKQRGVDGKTLETLEVQIELPADPATPPKPDALALLGTAGTDVDAVSYRLKSDKGVSNPVLIGFARAPLVKEQEPNDTAAKAQKISPPCEIVGRFYPHGDQDIYTFDAAKGDVLWLEIFSERLGQATAPELLLQKVKKDAKGEEQVSDVQDLGGAEVAAGGKRSAGVGFRAPSRDVDYRLDVKEDATYRITVRDLFDESTDNPALVYRLSIHKELPDFRLLATANPIADAKNPNSAEPAYAPPFLRKGGVVPLRITAFRQDGFDGAIRIEADGLPAGVHCPPVTIPPGESQTTLLLVADEDAAGGAGTVRIIGKAKIGDDEKTREARIGTIVWPSVTVNNSVEKAEARLTDEMPLSVSADESEPLSFDVGDGKLQATEGGKVQLKVTIKRRTELKQPLKVSVAGLPGKGGGAAKEMTIAPDATTGSYDLDLSNPKLPPGTYTLYLQAQAPIKFERKATPGKGDKGDKGDKKKKGAGKDEQATFYSPPITLTVTAKAKDEKKKK